MTSILDVRDLTVEFGNPPGVIGKALGRESQVLRAVDGVSLSLQQSVALAVVGESGCGKSTLARAISGLVNPTSGEVLFNGTALGVKRDKATRRRIQMVFQDPGSSLNPTMTIEQTLSEVLRAHRMVDKGEVRTRCRELVELVELPASVLSRSPRRLSGGQRQRVGIARALAVKPEILIADEAVAALDVSVQAAVLNLLRNLKERLNLTLMFISHDLAVVRNICDRVAVMYMGKIVEESDIARVFTAPQHPYTQALLAAAPRLGVHRRSGEAALKGEPPSPLAIPSGCRFHPRCPIAQDICLRVEPQLSSVDDHATACHFAGGVGTAETHSPSTSNEPGGQP